MRVRILGCGASPGCPSIEGGWGRCDPNEPRNRRTRASILVESAGTHVLVDTSPDLRQQLLAAEVTHLDAVLFTHAHADHLHGIDDLRSINRTMRADIPGYMDESTLDSIRERFSYVLEPLDHPDPDDRRYYKPVIRPQHVIAPGDRFAVGDLDVVAFDQDHGFSHTLGFRFGPVGYATDVTRMPEESFTTLDGVGLLIVGVLTDREHPTHAHVDKALQWIERVGPDRAVLTHMGTELDYATLKRTLPAGVEPAFDGMVIDVARASREAETSIFSS